MSDEHLSSAYRLSRPPSSHLTEETWEALGDGTLPASEREAAEDHVTRCEACATVYRGLTMFERESRALAAPTVSAPRVRTSFPYWSAAIAAMLVIGVAAGLLYRNSPSAPIKTPNAPTPAPAGIEARAEPVEPLAVRVAESRALTLRRPGGNSQAFLEAFNQAIAPYREGRFAVAVPALSELATRFPDAPEAPLYEGVALLVTGRTDAAIAALDRAASLAKGTEWEPDAEYYGARALLAAGLDQGRQTLVRLCDASGPYHAQSCRAIGVASPPPAR